jgi:hypothetical protein
VTIIENLLNNTWKSAEEQGREVPEPKAEDECMVRGLDDQSVWLLG